MTVTTGQASSRAGQSLRSHPTLNTLIWQLAECRCSVYSPFSFCLNVSIWTRKGTPFSPPCFLGVNSVLMQCTWEQKRWAGGKAAPSRALDPPSTPFMWRCPSLPGQCRPAPTFLLSPILCPLHQAGGLPAPLPAKDTHPHFCLFTVEALPDQLSPYHSPGH